MKRDTIPVKLIVTDMDETFLRSDKTYNEKKRSLFSTNWPKKIL